MSPLLLWTIQLLQALGFLQILIDFFIAILSLALLFFALNFFISKLR